jgi:uncharacterized protein YbaP (TraB family)
MHLQDKDLFTFGDSIYHAIEQSDGFALELNPVEMMDSVLKIFAAGDNSPLLKNILSKEEFSKVSSRLEKKLNIPADKITTKKISDAQRDWYNKFRKKDDMKTFIDMYLYTLAENQGKFTGGIEDVADQLGLFTDVGSLDVDEFLKENDTEKLKQLDLLKSIYRTRDLNGIWEMTYGKSGKAFHDLVLVKRNLKMAGRIDSLSHIRNTFFGIGAAHLPGDSGIISLLRERGFTVEPVISSRYINPGDYHYTVKEKVWAKIEDPQKNYSVEMPGQPTTMNLSGIIPMQLLIDLRNLYCYGVTAVPTNGANEDSLFSKISDSYKSLGFDVLSNRKLDDPGIKGMEMIIKNEDYFLKFRMIVRNNKLFMLIFGSQQRENLNAAQQVKYFNSLTINDAGLSDQMLWQPLVDSINAFSILMPGKPIYNFNPGTVATKYDMYTYNATDLGDGGFYSMTIQNTLPDFFIESDSIIFDGIKSRFKLLTDSGTVKVSEELINGHPGYKFSATKKVQGAEYAFLVYLVTRGNRIYMPMAVTEKDKQNSPQVKRFFSDFIFLPYQSSEWNRYSSPLNGFSAWLPGPLRVKDRDSSAVTEGSAVYSFDKGSSITYGILSKPMNPFFWSNSDSSYFKKLALTYKSEEDSIIHYQLLPSEKGVEVLIRLHNSRQVKKIKMILNGDTLYTMYSILHGELIEDKEVKKFFSGIEFTNPLPSGIFIPKQKMLMAALQSKDSLKRSQAREGLMNVEFTKNDLSLLHESWLVNYPEEEYQNRSTNQLIGEKIAAIADPATIEFIEKHYSQAKNEGLQMNMLEVLAGTKTSASYSVLKKLLQENPPSSGSVYSFYRKLSDSLLLSQFLFPELSKRYDDPVIGPVLVRLMDELLDSNLVSIEMVKANSDLVYSLSAIQLNRLKTDPDDYPVFFDYEISLLEKLNTPEAIKALNKFLTPKDNYFRYKAAVALIKLNKPVPAPVILSVAADNEYRLDLYNSLKEIKKEKLFPREMYSQQKFAESHVFAEAYEDVDSVKLTSVGERTYTVNGKLKRYYLFKVNLSYGEEKISHLGICGPFDADKNKVEANDDELQVNIFYDDKFSSATVEKLFREYMKNETEGAAEKRVTK